VTQGEIDAKELFAARRIIDRAERLVVISGAGMSADSGIATFRGTGSGGSWNTTAQSVATPEAFRADPQRVWTSYLLRRRKARQAEPHAGYDALAAWEQRAHVTVITQNVDGMHARSGSSNVIELHGTLFRVFCTGCERTVNGVDDEEQVPRCPTCGGYVRPGVVWFGEWIPPAALQASDAALREGQAILLVGTSLEVSSPRSLLYMAAQLGTPVIEVNPEPTLPLVGDTINMSGSRALPTATARLAGTAAVVLPRLLALEPIDSIS
jgi:NAD-dependent deacetylase